VIGDVAIPLVAFFIGIAATIAFAAIVFSPIVERRPRTQEQRFQIADLFSLIVLWQYVLLANMVLRDGSLRESHYTAFGGLLVLVLSALWYGLATTLSHRGVQSAIRRGAVICLGAPVGVIATIVLLPTVMMLLLGLLRSNGRKDVGESATVLVGCVGAGMASRAVFDWAMWKKRPSADDGLRAGGEAAADG
jgi:hypothetical protein